MLSPYSIPNIIVGTLFLLLGIFVFTKNPKRLSNRIFAAVCTTSTLWQILYAIAYNLKNENAAYWALRFGYIGVIFIPPFIGHYIFVVLKIEKKLQAFIRFMYLQGILFALLATSTPLLIRGVNKYFWGFYPIRGIIHPLFLFIFIGSVNVLIVVMCYYLFINRRRLTSLQLNQIKFLFIGCCFYPVASIDFIPNYGKEFYPFGYLPSFLFISIVGFTIVKYKLMEIDTVIHKTILWLLTLLIVILPIGLLEMFFIGWIYTLNPIAKLSLLSAVIIFSVWYYTKIKPHIDHFFRRRKYDYYQILGEIGQKIGSELDINRVVSRLFKELKDVIYIRNGLLLIQQPGEPDYTEVGSIGYEEFTAIEKERNVKLPFMSPLSQWLNKNLKAIEKEQLEADPQYEPIKEEASDFLNRNAIEIVIPVIMENKVNAILGIGKKENLKAYTIKDVELLENMGRQIGITIDNALHHEDIVEKERLAEEMRLGRDIQNDLLPRVTPQVRGLTLKGIMQPAKEIGGDYFDFIALPDKDKLSIVIGDVSGKGVAAGLLMAMAKTAVHILSQEEASPKSILLRTNAILNQHIGGQKFMTMLYFRWNPDNKTFTYSSAGHEHILIFHSFDNSVETVQSGGFMLGMIPDISQFLEDKSITLNPSDKIVLYTDGVTEARNPQEDMFGLRRLADIVSKNGSKSVDDLLDSIRDNVYSFIDTREQYDDITLVVMEGK